MATNEKVFKIHVEAIAATDDLQNTVRWPIQRLNSLYTNDQLD